MHSLISACCLVVACVDPGVSQPAGREICPAGPALLSLHVAEPPDGCVHPGELVHVTLALSCVNVPLTGYQAFVAFDPVALTFVEASYVLPAPFGLPLIAPTADGAGKISLAAGINAFAGQSPTQASADLAHLIFQADATQDVTRIRFSAGVHMTKVSTLLGPLIPILQDSTPLLVRACASCLWSDLNCDNAVDATDFVGLGGCMHGADVPVTDGCATADLDDDMDVDLHDVAVFQRYLGAN